MFVRFRDFRAGIALLPMKRVTLHGFWLNAVWELVQCPLFYDMWDWGLLRATVSMGSAIFGDVVIVLGVTASAGVIAGFANLRPLSWRGWITLLVIGFIASICLEWIALSMKRWNYTDWMPTITILGQGVGLLPVAQITLLANLSVYLATRKQPQT